MQPIYFIIYKNEKYLDFNTLLYLFTSSDLPLKSKKATLWRYLRKNKKIKKLKIQNKSIYSFEDIIDDTTLLGNMVNIQALANVLEN